MKRWLFKGAIALLALAVGQMVAAELVRVGAGGVSHRDAARYARDESELTAALEELMGEANRLVISTFRDGAAKLIDAVAPTATDDRALAMIWRS
mgnify:CR=1 FL=1